MPQQKVRNLYFNKCGRKATLPDLKFAVNWLITLHLFSNQKLKKTR